MYNVERLRFSSHLSPLTSHLFCFLFVFRFIIPPPLRDSPCLRGRKWVMMLNALCPSKLGGEEGL